MATLTITRTRPNTGVEWYVAGESVGAYIFENFPNVTDQETVSEDNLTRTIVKTGSQSDLQRWVNALSDTSSPVHERTAYAQANGITTTVGSIS